MTTINLPCDGSSTRLEIVYPGRSPSYVLFNPSIGIHEGITTVGSYRMRCRDGLPVVVRQPFAAKSFHTDTLGSHVQYPPANTQRGNASTSTSRDQNFPPELVTLMSSGVIQETTQNESSLIAAPTDIFVETTDTSMEDLVNSPSSTSTSPRLQRKWSSFNLCGVLPKARSLLDGSLTRRSSKKTQFTSFNTSFNSQEMKPTATAEVAEVPATEGVSVEDTLSVCTSVFSVPEPSEPADVIDDLDQIQVSHRRVSHRETFRRSLSTFWTREKR